MSENRITGISSCIKDACTLRLHFENMATDDDRRRLMSEANFCRTLTTEQLQAASEAGVTAETVLSALRGAHGLFTLLLARDDLPRDAWDALQTNHRVLEAHSVLQHFPQKDETDG